jgi:hypothetical protein
VARIRPFPILKILLILSNFSSGSLLGALGVLAVNPILPKMHALENCSILWFNPVALFDDPSVVAADHP